MDTRTRPLPAAAAAEPRLGIPGFGFLDLHRPEGLARLHASFLERLAAADPELGRRFAVHADGSARRTGPDESELLIAVARHLARFVEALFQVDGPSQARRSELLDRQTVFQARDRLLKKLGRRVELAPGQTAEEVRREAAALLERLPGRAGRERDEEEAFAARVLALLERPAEDPALPGERRTVGEALELLALDVKLRRTARDPSVAGWRMLRELRDVDFERGLLELVRPLAALPEAIEGPHARRRDGFKLTDPRGTHGEVMGWVDQCVLCHVREKDSCSRGLVDKKTGQVLKNPLGIALEGCPLDERVSEMHQLYGEGDAIAALAMVMVDNPMCPGTGHRICNDCMKACIYQKQEPVNIPQVETRVLTDVLELPFGPEIWLLLTRWNPLRVERPYALPYNGIDVLVVGMGPAGYTLATWLANEGFGVVGVDGLKSEPLPGARARADALAEEVPPIPLASWAGIRRELDERVLLGFGGVSEYGITVRWDKNFLTLPYLSLLRRPNFELFSGVRFGGTLDLEQAWQHGFDHVAIATGAGKPTIVEMKNNLSRGIRKASDFLMGLQLTGAFKRDSMASLQLRLPVIVIGGGLTGIDTATEALAYYPLQVEKTAARYAELAARFGAERVRRFFNEEELFVLDEFVGHGRAVQAERARAESAGETPDFARLVRGWGGVRLVYRKALADAPAYRLNHEEVEKALEEGITFVECMSPLEALLDRHGAVRGVVFERQHKTPEGRWRGTGERVEMPAGSVLVAAGTSPNVTYERERPGTFQLDRWQSFFRVHRARAGRDTARGGARAALDPVGELEPVEGGRDAAGPAFLTSYVHGGRTVSVYGDNHPAYAGNVVKAMASARTGQRQIVELFRERIAATPNDERSLAERRASWRRLVDRLHGEFDAVVHEVNRLTPTITEVVVRAPAAARRFQPGQFYRLQNFESSSRLVHGTRLALEGLALTGAWTDPERGLLSMIVLEMGASSRLCALLQPGEKVIVMGPTGAPTEIPAGEKVILAGGGLGNAVLFSIGRALRANGCQVVYFAAFKRGEDLFKREEIESAADVVVWSTDSGSEIEPARERPFDRHFRGNVVQAMLAYARGELEEPRIRLEDCQRIVCIGSDRMMNAVRESRHGVLAPHLMAGHVAIGSINSPMQCMMKEICAQCLCRHVDPATGAEIAPVFSCFNQDQPLDQVDFENLMQRLRANSVQEKLANLWLDLLVHEAKLPLWSTL
jgi:NADPH-dependent glutamate synthase beta subunit-like oxidoreductase/NAD(P)H-flavin reductase